MFWLDNLQSNVAVFMFVVLVGTDSFTTNCSILQHMETNVINHPSPRPPSVPVPGLDTAIPQVESSLPLRLVQIPPPYQILNSIYLLIIYLRNLVFHLSSK